MALVRLIEINHAVFLASLLFYCALGASFPWTLFQYLRLRSAGRARERSLLSTPLPPDDQLPNVLVQLPSYNEGALIHRVCAAVADLDWPRDRLKVQILDDSTDGSEVAAEQAAQALHALGVEALLRRRTVRHGFKAGAMAEGLRLSDDPFVAVFDADYVPPPNFLKTCIRPLIADPGLAFVQARIDFHNGEENLVTRVQQRILDAHYAIEQPARCWSGQIAPFNGTGGIWRRAAIDDAGGWEGDTLAEDMDLSLRVHMRGWRGLYLTSISVPGELPNSFKTWRSQQYRWNKGTATVSLKLIASVWRSGLSFGQKTYSTIQLGGGFFGLLFVVTAVSGVVDVVASGRLSALAAVMLALLLLEVVGGPMLLQLAGQKVARGRSLITELVSLPKVTAIHLGVSLINLGAGLEVLTGRGNDWDRTPKAGKPLEMRR
jgi:cellulose synthase/poly-beta-1,6-N-acetylglucosamine synthase-like glycosyltransferase